jgi:hypothetical protein
MATRHLLLACCISLLPAATHAEIIEKCTEDIAEARTAEAAKSKGGPDNNKLTNTDAPTRNGKTAFKHWINTRGERSELKMGRAEIGGEYWYGWSLFLPGDFDPRESISIVMQLATFPTPRNGKFPLGANGSYMAIEPDGRLSFKLQHKGEGGKDSEGTDFTVVDDITPLKDRWLDFIMHAKWTGQNDGFLKLWVRTKDDNAAMQKLDWKGRTFWDDEDTGPSFKMGLYTGEPGWKGPSERTLFTDDYRLGDARSSFAEVDPKTAR